MPKPKIEVQNTAARGNSISSSNSRIHPMTDNDLALRYLLELLPIIGVSGGEVKIADAVVARLTAAGCRHDWISRDDVGQQFPDRLGIGNVIVKLPGTLDSRRQLFVAHLDTVPLCLGCEPVRDGNRIVARGKTAVGADNRTGVACLISVIKTILTDRVPHPPLTFLFTVAEEIGLLGARHVDLDMLGNPEIGVNIDSGDPEKLIIGAVGADRWEIEVSGISAHAGVHPEDGVSASLIASIAITDVHEQGYFGKITKNGHTGTSNVGVIRGGDALNQVTDSVIVKGESRSHDIKFIDEITEVYRNAFEKAATGVANSQGKSGWIDLKVSRDYQPFALDMNSAAIKYATGIAADAGLTAQCMTVNGGLDASALNARGIPTITIGAGQHNAHTIDEYVDIDEFLTGCRFALALATGQV